VIGDKARCGAERSWAERWPITTARADDYEVDVASDRDLADRTAWLAGELHRLD